VLNFEVPFWIDSDDVHVDITETGIRVEVRNEVFVRRTFWRNAEEESRSDAYRVVDVDECSWQLEDDIGQDGEKCKLLSVTLVRPPLTEDEIQWKKGVRQDNRQGKRRGGPHGLRGYRFFVDDEDEYGLEDYLQALCLLQCGKAWVPVKPWDTDCVEGRWATSPMELGREARSMLERLALAHKTEGGETEAN